ncbi:MAG: type II toxin-antitoxin system VapC family toxin [Bacillota bacterium]|nr:type II toxin-antitoxin system VapC family toxin [Bacillota bacterium]
MTTYLVDTSALFKLYLPERGSERMESLFFENAEVLISTLTMVEFLSNLQRLHLLDKGLDDNQFSEVWSAFSLDLATGRIQALGVSSEVIDEAIQLLLTRYVTPVDALQVAAAKSLGAEATVVSSDRKLNQLVTTLGLRFLDPSQEDAR